MNRGMVYCQECGRWFFNWKKLSSHLIEEHHYSIPIPKEEDNATPSQVSVPLPQAVSTSLA